MILVTNALQFLKHPKVTKIVVLQDGRAVEEGTYAVLAARKNSVFSRFLTVIAETGISTSDMGSEPEGGSSPVEFALPSNGTASPNDAPKTGVAKTMTEETRQTGHVTFGVYASWAKAAGGFLAPVSIVLAFASGEAMQVLSNWFLTYWSEHGSPSAASQNRFLGIYACISVFVAMVGACRTIVIIAFGLVASRRVSLLPDPAVGLHQITSGSLTIVADCRSQLFADLLAAVLHAPMSFFDTTPVGRLVNRFSKGRFCVFGSPSHPDLSSHDFASDIFTIDEQLNATLGTYLSTLFTVFSTIVVISGVTPVFAFCLIPMMLFYVWQQSYFTVRASQTRHVWFKPMANDSFPTDHLSRTQAS